MANGDHLGPSLAHVEPDDLDALQALFAEQRARLDVVREHRIWQWLGGMPAGFGSPRAMLHGLYLQIAIIALVAIGLVLAGFTRGPWLWLTFGLVAFCFGVRWLLVVPPSRQTLRYYQRAVLAPAVIVAEVPDADPALQQVRCAAVLVAVRKFEPHMLRELVAAGDRLRRMVAGTEPVPADATAFVAAVRAGLEARIDDGSRIAVPCTIGSADSELARIFVPIPLLPREELSSRLLFVLLDPDCRDAGHARVVQSSLWGNGVERLCEAYRLEGRP